MLLDLGSIVVKPDRQRREFDPAAHQEISASIAAKGLMHPIVVEADMQTLVAGETRLRIITDLHDLGIPFKYNGEAVPAGKIPASCLAFMSELEIEEAQLDENIKRRPLTWQEHAAAVAKLAEIRNKQAAEAGKIPPTYDALKKEIYPHLADSEGHRAAKKVSREILVSRHLADADVMSAKSVDEAFKVLKHKEARRKNAQLAETIGLTYSANVHTLINADCLDWMQAAPESSFDVILTDPPYGMGADTFSDSGKGGLENYSEHDYDDSYESWLPFINQAIPLLTRVAKPAAHAYLFCDLENFQYMREQMTAAGWRVFRTPLIWFKPSAYRAPWPEHGPQRKYECILFAVRGDKKCLRVAGDVIECSPDANLGHPAQKPVALLRDLLGRSALPGDSVLDFCCGSGSIFPAAHELKLRATGIELGTSAYGLAASRLGELK